MITNVRIRTHYSNDGSEDPDPIFRKGGSEDPDPRQNEIRNAALIHF